MGLKCEGKEPSEDDKFVIDVIGVIRMSIQCITKLVGKGSKSDDLLGTHRTIWRISSSVTQVRFCMTFLVTGDLSMSQRRRKSE